MEEIFGSLKPKPGYHVRYFLVFNIDIKSECPDPKRSMET